MTVIKNVGNIQRFYRKYKLNKTIILASSYASTKLDKIIRWSEGNFGEHFAKVDFIIKPDKIATWASKLNLNIQPQEDTITFVQSNNGWHYRR